MHVPLINRNENRFSSQVADFYAELGQCKSRIKGKSIEVKSINKIGVDSSHLIMLKIFISWSKHSHTSVKKLWKTRRSLSKFTFYGYLKMTEKKKTSNISSIFNVYTR